MISLIFFLSGCSLDKQVIQNVLEDSAELEKSFVTNLKQLSEARENARYIYQGLLDFHINEKKKINEKISEAISSAEQQQQLLEEAESNFQELYNKLATIEDVSQKLEGKKLKKETSKLVRRIEERKQLMEAFFENYQEQIQFQLKLYEDIKSGKVDLTNLTEKTNGINKNSLEMGEIIEKYNQSTEQFHDVKKNILQIVKKQ